MALVNMTTSNQEDKERKKFDCTEPSSHPYSKGSEGEGDQSQKESCITISPDSIPLFPHQRQRNFTDKGMTTTTTPLVQGEEESVEMQKNLNQSRNYGDRNCSSNDLHSTIYAFPEDDEGEPVVDDEVLQSLMQSREEDDNEIDADYELNDPVMLECDKVTSTMEDEEIDDVGEESTIRRSLLMRHGRHPSTIIEEQSDQPQHQQPVPTRCDSPLRSVNQLSSSLSSGSLKRTSPSRRNLLTEVVYSPKPLSQCGARSEERRVGKEC